MSEQQKDLVQILNSGEPSETLCKDVMHVVLVPFEADVPIGVHFKKTYGEEVKCIPRSAMPEKFRKEIYLGDLYIVAGNLMTKYSKDVRFTRFELATEKEIKAQFG